MLKFACALCSGALLRQWWLTVRCRQVFATCIWYRVPRASTGLSKHGTRPTAVFLIFSVLAQGGGGLHAYFRKQHCMGFHKHDCDGGSLTPAPPPSPEIGRKVPDRRCQRRWICWMWQRVKNMCFHPMCLYSILGFFRRFQQWTKTRTFQLAPNHCPISEHHFPEMATTLVGGTQHPQLESPEFNSWCLQL